MTGKTILLVEDNLKVMRNNTAALKSRGAIVFPASTYAEAMLLIGMKAFDVAVIDIMLPDGSGLELLREIRSASNLPVLLLTAKGDSEDIVAGLALGADDYLAKPYYLNVFTARIEALLRRAGTVSESFAVGHLRFDLISNRAFCGDKDLLLTQKEFALLLLLAQNQGLTLSAEYLFEKVWRQPMGDTSALRLQISNMKKKISAVTGTVLIETSRGKGYSITLL